MCNYQTLYHDDRIGYIIRCTRCEKIQMSYGNLFVTFKTEEFDTFRWWLKKIKDNVQPGQNERLRSLVIPTPCEGVKLLLSSRELDEFNTMMDQADSELQSLEMIKLFAAAP